MKRSLDLVVAAFGLAVFSWLICLGAVIARVRSGVPGIRAQVCVGRHGRLFRRYTLRVAPTQKNILRFPRRGWFRNAGEYLLRMTRVEMLPQLWNVLRGDMSLVGPRAVPRSQLAGLQGADLLIVTVRPGMTGPAMFVGQPATAKSARTDFDERALSRTYIQQYRLRDDLRYLGLALLQGSWFETRAEQPVQGSAGQHEPTRAKINQPGPHSPSERRAA